MNRTTVDMHADCVELVSGSFRLAVTTRVGPRIIGGFLGDSPNIFRVMPDEPLPNCDTGFQLYGGHRFWHSPEAMPRTYAPDNEPITVSEEGSGVAFAPPPEPLTGLQKTIVVEPLGNERFRILHRLTNHGQWTVEAAPWALSVMAPGGMAIVPQNRAPNANPFVPDRCLVFWPYSDPHDARLVLGNDYILLKQDSSAVGPCKIGFNAEAGWIAYVNAGTALVKSFEHFAEAEYPDNGCSAESYSCADFCEIETLGPLYNLDPGDTAEHVELWTGIAGLPAIATEWDIRQHLIPRMRV